MKKVLTAEELGNLFGMPREMAEQVTDIKLINGDSQIAIDYYVLDNEGNRIYDLKGNKLKYTVRIAIVA